MEELNKDYKNKIISTDDDEITIKDIILKIQQWWGIVWLKKNLIIGVSLVIGMSAAVYTKYFNLPTYEASYQLFFEEDSGGLSSAMRLASSFGLSIGGNSGSSTVAVQQYLTSRDNIAKAMMADLDSGLLVDRYFEKILLDEPDFALEYSEKFNKNSRFTDSIFTIISLKLKEEEYVSASLNEDNGILSFRVVSEKESFAYDLANELIANTENKFISWKQTKSQGAVDAFQGKVDSLELAIDATLIKLGEYEDQNNSLVSSVDKMKRIRLTIDLETLKLAYGEYIKGLEMSKAELMNLEPPFMYFDDPTYPLEKDEDSAVLKGAFGAVITSFLLIIFFIGKVETKNIMT